MNSYGLNEQRMMIFPLLVETVCPTESCSPLTNGLFTRIFNEEVYDDCRGKEGFV